MSSVSAATLSEIIDKFVKEVSLGNSIDWFLIKLSSAIDELEALARFSKVSTREYVVAFLRDERVRKQLSRISCYIEEVQHSISSSPRFRSLRPYLSDIVDVLRHIPCSEVSVEEQAITRRDLVYGKQSRESSIHRAYRRMLIPIRRNLAKPRTRTRLGTLHFLERLATYTLCAIAITAAILLVLQLVY